MVANGEKKVKATKAKAPKVAKERKPREPRDVTQSKCMGYAPTTKIQLGVDKEGGKYSPKNNPNKGVAGEKFALFKDGMTIGQARAAGVRPMDIRAAFRKKYISLIAA